MTVRGWGTTWLNEFDYDVHTESRYLMAAKQVCLDRENHCSNNKYFGDEIVCAGDRMNTKNAACYGDSGGNHL